jgi:hypothetical protein
MNIPTEEDIDLMDKFLKGKFENRKFSLANRWYKEQFNLDTKTIDRILNLIGEYTHLESLATTQIIDGKFIIVRFDEFKTENFIRNDGFKSYFDAFKEEIVAESEYKTNLRDSAKPKKWYKKDEIIIPIIFGFVSLGLSGVLSLYISSQGQQTEQLLDNKLKEIADSLSTTYKSRYDSLLDVTKNSLDSLNNSYDSILKK